MQFYNSDKLKYYLREESKRLGISIGNTYNTFFARILLERITRNLGDKIVVGGSFSQLVHLGRMVRPVTDIDFLSNAPKDTNLLDLIRVALNNSIEDLQFVLKDNFSVSSIGMLKLRCDACFGTIQHTVNVEIKTVNVNIYEKLLQRVPKIFQADTEYFTYAPSFEEHLAEKLCIVVEIGTCHGNENTRVKDLYDIYKMHGGNYDLQKFALYFERMLADRGKTKFEEVTTEFLNNAYVTQNQEYWDNSSNKYDFLDKEITFAEAVFYTKAVLSEQLQRIRDGENDSKSTILELSNKKAPLI